MPLQDQISAAPPIRETIAQAIFEARYHRSWDKAKHDDQWLAMVPWKESAAVLRALPLAVQK